MNQRETNRVPDDERDCPKAQHSILVENIQTYCACFCTMLYKLKAKDLLTDKYKVWNAENTKVTQGKAGAKGKETLLDTELIEARLYDNSHFKLMS